MTSLNPEQRSISTSSKRKKPSDDSFSASPAAVNSSKKQKSYDANTIKLAIKKFLTGQSRDVATIHNAYPKFRAAISKYSPKDTSKSAPEKFITEAVFELYLDNMDENYFIRNDDAFFRNLSELLELISSKLLNERSHTIFPDKSYQRKVSLTDVMCHKMTQKQLSHIFNIKDIVPNKNCEWLQFAMSNHDIDVIPFIVGYASEKSKYNNLFSSQFISHPLHFFIGVLQDPGISNHYQNKDNLFALFDVLFPNTDIAIHFSKPASYSDNLLESSPFSANQLGRELLASKPNKNGVPALFAFKIFTKPEIFKHLLTYLANKQQFGRSLQLAFKGLIMTPTTSAFDTSFFKIASN